MQSSPQPPVTLTQAQRFELHARAVQTFSLNWPISTFTDWLTDPERSLIYREYALTALALKATAQSGAIIDAYNPNPHGPDHHLFHQIARTEWKDRFKNSHPRDDVA